MRSIWRTLLVIGCGAVLAAPPVHAGNLFVTGHDSDEHENGDYMSAGLDYLLFGTAKTPADRTGKTIALLDNSGGDGAVSTLNAFGWTAVLFDTDADFSGAFDLSSYDAIMTASGDSSDLNTALIGSSASFTSYFNAGGSLFINTDEGFGQPWYDFIPQFGTTANNTISEQGAFTPTAAGLGIGLTEAVVDADITHSFYTGVDTSFFTVFEVTDTEFFDGPEHPAPVAFGARSIIIDDGGFGDGDGNGADGPAIPEPASLLLFSLGGLTAGLTCRRRI